jgi:hypothetical protein
MPLLFVPGMLGSCELLSGVTAVLVEPLAGVIGRSFSRLQATTKSTPLIANA